MSRKWVRSPRFASVAVASVSLAVSLLAAIENRPRSAQSDPPAAPKIPVFVSDFELFSTAVAHAPKRTVPAEGDGRQGNPVYLDTDPTTVQARRVMDAFATTLVRLLEKEGYPAERQTGNNYPQNGLVVRGVFTEPDGQNRIRRALFGGGSTSPQFALYVGVFNLARQDQPLYQLAPVQSADSHYGPVITLNAYVPLVKFDVDKSPSEEDVRKVCTQIVGQLTTFVGKNAAAVKP